MSGWRRRWAYLWELASERERDAAAPEHDGGRERALRGAVAHGRVPNTVRARLGSQAGHAPAAAASAPGVAAAGPAPPAAPAAPVQRVPADAPLAPPTDPVVLRESVRIALARHHAAQQDAAGAQRAPLALSPELEEQLLRLMPGLDADGLARLWQPPPENAIVALGRLMRAGHVPRMALPQPRPEPSLDPRALAPSPPAPERELEGRLSPFGAGMLGLHFRVNPRRRALPEENIAAALRGRGLQLREGELETLLQGRKQGIEEIDRALGTINTGLDPAQRRRIAEMIADVLLDKSLQGQLERELPTGAERERERQRMLEPEPPGGLRGLVERMPVGASITFHFP